MVNLYSLDPPSTLFPFLEAATLLDITPKCLQCNQFRRNVGHRTNSPPNSPPAQIRPTSLSSEESRGAH